MDKATSIGNGRIGRFHIGVTGLILLVTVLGAGTALLQTHASVRESQATRDSVVTAVELMGALDSGALRAAYDTGIAVDTVTKMMEYATYRLAALELEQNGRNDEAALYERRAEQVEAEIIAAGALSVLFTDDRYAPEPEASLMPDIDAYMEDWREPIDGLLARQQEQAQAADQWGDRADAYTSVATVLALSLFLFGLSLSIPSRMRTLFAAVGSLLVCAALGWTAWTILLT
jgi:hypothetical protein